MSRTIRKRNLGRDERGAISVMIALGLTVMLGSAAIAIDLGHMMNVRTESQRVADLAALAGAAAFIDAPGATVAATAEAWAINWAAQNTVNQTAVTLSDTDVTVDVANQTVTVRVENIASRGNAISTIFARILGIQTVDIATEATAEASITDGVSCVLPLFLVDRWDELGGSALQFDPGIDYYEPFDPLNPTSTYTGYDEAAIGTTIIIKPANGPPSQSSRPNPSWYFPFEAGSVPGGANYAASIADCLYPDYIYQIGDQVDIETGAKIGPTNSGFTNLINQDPNAAWDPNLKCVMDASDVGSGNPLACRGSPRLRPVPMFDPEQAPPTGSSQPVTISNFSGVFVDRIQGNDVYVILAGYQGVGSAGSPSWAPPIIKKLRLIK